MRPAVQLIYRIAITGHRNLLDPAEVKEEIRDFFLFFLSRGIQIHALSSLAKGTDTIFAQLALELEIPLHVTLPFQLEEYKKDFEGYDLQTLEILLRNKDFKVVNTITSTDKGERDCAYLKAGMRLVDECDVVLAVWDGNEAKGMGGTADIVDYAHSTGKELHIIRAGQNTPTDARSHPADDLFSIRDHEAIENKTRFNTAFHTGIAAGLLGALCFALTTSSLCPDRYKLHLSIGEAVCLGLSFYCLMFSAKKNKEKFLVKRRGAEYLRAIIRYREARIPILPMSKADFEPDSDIKKIEQDMINASPPSITNVANAQRVIWSVAYRQANYHQERVKRLQKRRRSFEWTFTLLILGFVLIILANLLVEYTHPEHELSYTKWCTFLLIALPSFYAYFEGIKYFGDWKRKVIVSQKTGVLLEAIKARVQNDPVSKELIALSRELRNVLDLENSYWALEVSLQEIEPKL